METLRAVLESQEWRHPAFAARATVT
jgi:hypothetical protein